MNSKIQTIFIKNLHCLIKESRLKRYEFAKKCGVSERNIHYLLTEQRVPTIKIAEKIASAFKLEVWQLLIEELPLLYAKRESLSALINNFAQAEDDGKEYILRIAEKEASY